MLNKIRSLYYRVIFFNGTLRSSIESRITRLRFIRNKHTDIPFYDRRSRIYRIFFNDRSDEFGSINYIVSEYIRDGLIYHYSLGKDKIVHHEHAFEGILRAVMNCGGRNFSVSGFEDEYSEQELKMLRKYIKPNENWK